MAKNLLLLLAALTIPSSIAALKIDELVNVCNLQDDQSHLGDCMRLQGHIFIQHLVPGIQQWKILPIDPLLVHVMDINITRTLYLKLSNISLTGHRELAIEHISFDPKSLQLALTAQLPKFHAVCSYYTEGHILQVPINGNGALQFNADNMGMKMFIQFERAAKKGKEYLKISNLKTTSDPRGKMTIKLDNLFNSNVLSDLMNRFLNSNALAVYRVTGSYLDRTVSYIQWGILEKLFSNVPYNELFNCV